MKPNNRVFGRPLKGKDRRVSVAVYVTGSTLETIDEYVAERQTRERTYSRSDFFNEAVEKLMRERGLLEVSPEEEAERKEYERLRENVRRCSYRVNTTANDETRKALDDAIDEMLAFEQARGGGTEDEEKQG